MVHFAMLQTTKYCSRIQVKTHSTMLAIAPSRWLVLCKLCELIVLRVIRERLYIIFNNSNSTAVKKRLRCEWGGWTLDTAVSFKDFVQSSYSSGAWRLVRQAGVVHFKKIFQKAMAIYIAIQSVCLCAYPSVMFPHIVLKRLNISSYFLQHMVAQSLNFFQY